MKKNLFDLIIIGSGPAGLSAAIYAGRAKLRTLVIDSQEASGQISITAEVVNYPGIPTISGPELSEQMRKQAAGFGAEFTKAKVLSVDAQGDIKTVRTDAGDFQSVGIIIATGARPRTLGFEGEKEFTGRGVGYCATCDGEFFTGLDVFVVGGGFAAAEEAIFLTRFASKVHVVVRGEEFSCSKSIAEKVLAHPKIQVHFNTEVQAIGGDSVLRWARLINNKTSELWNYRVEPQDSTFGLFVFIGYEPQSHEFEGLLKMDDAGYILTNEEMQTSISGIYAAGDIRPKALRQLVTAVSDGAIASTHAEKYIDHKKEELGLEIKQQEKKPQESKESFFSAELLEQLAPVLERFENPVQLRVILDSEHELSEGIRDFAKDFAGIHEKISVEILEKGQSPQKEQEIHAEMLPVIALLDHTGAYTGIQYHAVPSGHEFNSFVLALYNVAGPGQQIEASSLEKIKKLSHKLNIKVGATLSCTMCPDVVVATQLIARHNPLIEAEMIDVSHFPHLREKHKIMSVPAIIVNDTHVTFGKRSLDELVDYFATLS